MFAKLACCYVLYSSSVTASDGVWLWCTHIRCRCQTPRLWWTCHAPPIVELSSATSLEERKNLPTEQQFPTPTQYAKIRVVDRTAESDLFVATRPTIAAASCGRGDPRPTDSIGAAATASRSFFFSFSGLSVPVCHRRLPLLLPSHPLRRVVSSVLAHRSPLRPSGQALVRVPWPAAGHLHQPCSPHTNDWLEFNGTFSTIRLYQALKNYSCVKRLMSVRASMTFDFFLA